MTFRNKVALITDGSRGIGRVITLKLASKEADVTSLKTVEDSVG